MGVVEAEQTFDGNARFPIRAKRLGEARLRLKQPAGFGPAPDGDLMVRVMPRRIGSRLPSAVLAKGLQQTSNYLHK